MTKSKKRPTLTKLIPSDPIEDGILQVEVEEQPSVADHVQTDPIIVPKTTRKSTKKSSKVTVLDTSSNELVPAVAPRTKKPAGKGSKKGKLSLNSLSHPISDTPTLQIANIILHLKCSMSDLDAYNEDVNRQLTDPLLYNPSVPPDIMAYHQAEQYSILDDNQNASVAVTHDNYAYMESNTRISSPLPSVSVSMSTQDPDTNVISDNTHVEISEKEDTNQTNMKDINTKLKKLKISLFRNMAFMDKKSACFWCTYDFDNPECYIPRYEMDGTIHGYGSFCRPECAAAHLMKENMDDSTKFERYHLLNQIYSKIYDYKKNIKPAPNPYYLLEKYYGNLTIQEYRKLLKSDHLLLVIDKPLTRILPELHEDNEDFLNNIYGSGGATHVSGSSGSSASKASKTNTIGGYKVRRQSEKQAGPTKSKIIKEHFGITT
jgi:hypothetical protein